MQTQTYSNVVDDEPAGSHSGELLVRGRGLDERLGGVRQEAVGDAADDLHNVELGERVGRGTVADHETGAERLNTEAGNDEPLQGAEPGGEKRGEYTGEGAGDAGEAGDVDRGGDGVL